MKLIVGLGNPKEKYRKNRHNLGFRALDYFVEQNELEEFKLDDKFHSEISENSINGKKVILAKPRTFMNASGEAVSLISKYYKIKPTDILVVYDELALDFGLVRTREEGSSAGHNGVESIIKTIGKPFNRVRVGIANDHAKKAEASEFVLADFSKDEEDQLTKIFDYTNQLIHEYIYTEKLEAHTHNCLENLL